MDKTANLLVNKGLYDSVDITIDDLEEIEKYLSKKQFGNNIIDCYCVSCATLSTFKYFESEVHEQTTITRMAFVGYYSENDSNDRKDIFSNYLNKNYILCYDCSRNRQHSLLFDLFVTKDKIIKIGQYPSVADLAVGEIAKYKSALGKQHREFAKAIGLHAHGVGIGSFVYVRRIIENLVFDNFNNAKGELKITETEFEQLRFDKKIEVLQTYQPSVLVQNKNYYGIVSKGVHELSEEECLKMFPLIKTGIELILDDLLAANERVEKEKLFQKFVADTTGKLKAH